MGKYFFKVFPSLVQFLFFLLLFEVWLLVHLSAQVLGMCEGQVVMP